MAIPSTNDDDSLYCIAKILNGNNAFDYYFGKFDKREWGEDYTLEYQGSDFYTIYTSSVASATTISGYDDFANMTVNVTINGVDQGNKLVSNTGVITVNVLTGDRVVVGLPYTSTVAPMYITDQNNINKIKGSQKALLHFKDTLSAKAGQIESSIEEVRFDGDDTGLKSGMAEVYFNNASDYLNTCFVVQEKAEPCTLLSMIAYIE